MTDYERAYGEQSDYFGAEPAPLLMKHVRDIRRGGRVLDVGVGQGRNALPLARQGFEVTGIDTSEAAIEASKALSIREGLSLSFRLASVFDFAASPMSFDAVLLFGLLQCLSRRQSARLIDLVSDWTAPGGIVFVTAWHVGDPSYETNRTTCECVEGGSFRLADGELRTYFAPGEILELFAGWTIAHHWEGLGPSHHHGDGKMQRHGNVELVAQRR